MSGAADDGSCCAIIPARGGSKGIPRKNLIKLAGRPLLVHSIEACLRAETIDGVYVSTDDEEIAAVARAAGSDVIERPAHLSGDHASSEDALLHALDEIESRRGGAPDIFAFLQCTSPLTQSGDIDDTVRCVSEGGYDSAFAATAFHYFLWKRDGSGQALGVNHDASKRLLRQEREPEYLEAGAVYAMKVAGFREAKHRFFGRIGMYEMPPSRCFEIDDEDDLRIARALMVDATPLRGMLAKMSKPELICFDFDGVFTDNRVLVGQSGDESVICDRGDGMGLAALKATGVPVYVLSTETNPVVTARCDKLGIPCVQGLGEKLDTLRDVAATHGADLAHTVYVGNDRNDVTCLEAVGCGAAPSDAHSTAIAAADVVLERRGGMGAVREVCDAVVERLGE